MRQLTFIALCAALCLSCSREGEVPSQKPPDYYNFFKEYSLEPESATIEARELVLEKVGSEQCADTGRLVLCAQGNWMAFTVEIRNDSQETIQVSWAGARYVDESGTEHPVDPRGEGMLSNKVESVVPGTSIRRTVDAVGKRRVLGTGEYAYVGYEPLLPWTHDDNPERTKSVVEELYTKRTAVLLRLPVGTGDDVRTVEWTFRLSRQEYRVL